MQEKHVFQEEKRKFFHYQELVFDNQKFEILNFFCSSLFHSRMTLKNCFILGRKSLRNFFSFLEHNSILFFFLFILTFLFIFSSSFFQSSFVFQVKHSSNIRIIFQKIQRILIVVFIIKFFFFYDS